MSRRSSVEMRPHPWRRRLVLGGWLVCCLAISLRAAQIQVVDRAEWRSRASKQHQGDVAIEAPRGLIKDRNGIPLSVSRDRTRVEIAPPQVVDADSTSATLVRVLGVTPRRARRMVASGVWNTAGLFPPSVRDELRGTSGVHLTRSYQRSYPHEDLARGVIGRVIDGTGTGGIESVFESWLSGVPGVETVPKDSGGDPIPGERVTVRSPRAGGEVVLTLDMDLQEIAQSALLEAIEKHDARGGDVVITDPRTGEILALFSTQDGQLGALSAVNTPFEPGSTLKPFTVAGLLKHGVAALGDTVDVEDGSWEHAGRTIHDTHGEGRMTVREALRESSNVGIAKAALPMSPGMQYENLRDFGFGSYTGIELPGESEGTLRRPGDWTAQSAASLAIGYEIAVTPLQLAMAYGALANGGLLMRPRLVKELRDADGTVVESFEPEVVRRVVDERTAQAVGRALVDVVEDGTGTLARLGTFQVAGKSGTARLNTGNGYQAGEYSSSFVGYFPADRPQLVVFVKLDRPQGGDYYGGAVAAPVTRTTMEAALAASAVIDITDLAGSTRNVPPSVSEYVLTQARWERPEPALPPELATDGVYTGPEGAVSLPDVSGFPARTAIRHLHRLGLRVTQVGVGEIVRTSPAAGTPVFPGDTIRLRYRGQQDD